MILKRINISLTCILIVTTTCIIKLNAQITGPAFTRDPVLIEQDTAGGPHHSRLTFERLLSSFQWNFTHRTSFFSERWFLMLDEQFRSTLIRTDRNFLKDQQELRMLAGHRITDRFDIRMQGSSLFLSDDQITGLNDAGINSAHGGFGYVLYPGLTLAPLIGYVSDRQADRTDKGLSYLARLQGSDLELMDEFFMHIDAQYLLNKVDPRETAQHYVYLSADREFEGQTYAGFRTYYTSSRREFYFPADQPTQDIYMILTNIDRRNDRRIGTSGEMQYEINPSLIGRFTAALDWRNVTRGYHYQQTVVPSQYLYDTAVDEFMINLQLSMRYYLGRTLTGFTYISYSERAEEHTVSGIPSSIPPVFYERRIENEFIKNNISKRTTVGTYGNIRMHAAHRFLYSGSASILRYDTPSTLNFDDRDELRIFSTLGTEHDIGRYVKLRLGIDLTYSHIVYLKAQRSANNNKNRVLRFIPSVTYSPFPWLTTTNGFEVLANYTVYDFEDVVSNLRSLSYRQVGWLDSTRVNLSKSTSLSVFSQYRRYERGELQWKGFSERPVTSFEELTLIAMLRYELFDGDVAFAGGIRYFRQDRYRYEVRDRIFETRFINSGPICSVYWRIGRKYLLKLNGWYERQSRDGRTLISIPNLSVDINTRF
jgi:hypothetical protein